MSDHDAIADLVRDVAPSIALGPGQYDQSLFDLGIDSLDHASILLQVEERFGVKIPDEAAEALTSVSAIAGFVTSCRAS